MSKKQLILTEQMIKLWKECVTDYLEKLCDGPIGELKPALLADGVLVPRFKRKGSFLLEPDMLVAEAHFLKSGMAMLYSIDKKSGQPKIFYIWEPGTIIVLYKEFRETLPSDDYFIEIIEDSEVVSITSLSMDGIYQEHTIAYALTQKILAGMKKRLLVQMDILLTPVKSDRYSLFEEKFPGLRGKLSNDVICCFIGVGPTTLVGSKA
ncbi:CRP-like cAMP-binding protein [Pedobacter africanus]|uniref:CRP-like cAMP-binding protein n=1 Tax=Pedobacter africanus TaxID=151894 RepID=A0ACC6L4M6_9SPHI|nr:Crp/Fnr family transcriptional regulator [Pedobacter africanus]MDR6786462.1 CRP-like cAMP-binding protein [Pedobacter africanus]